MNWVHISIALTSGFALGFLISWLLGLGRTKKARQLAEEIFLESEERRQANINNVIERVRESFGGLSLDVLSKSTEEFLKLAKEKFDSERQLTSHEMDTKKGLIDEKVRQLSCQLEDVSRLVKELEKDRTEKFGKLTGQLKTAGEQTSHLMETTNMLREALASSRVRGQWGERMAEDVLRIAGFVENVNYQKQKMIAGSAGTRPDFTFFLPQDLRLHMDVKFPLDNYLKHLESTSEADKERFLRDFLRDVKARIKEVTTREYINAEQGTVDCVLLFLPNEQIYSFIHEQDRSIMDTALQKKVVLCSPITLLAVLAVIRQAVDNFSLEQTSNEILSLLGTFKKQWGEFLKRLDLMGKRISEAQREFDTLTTTRRRQLERPLLRMEELRMERGLPAAEIEETALAREEAMSEQAVSDE